MTSEELIRRSYGAAVLDGARIGRRRAREKRHRHTPETKLAGLYDLAEAGDFQVGLETAGFGSYPSRAQMESVGFFACVEDLEDELIRALGIVEMERLVETQGDLRSFRTFQNQPAWRGRATDVQVRRFIGTKSGRKVRYAGMLVSALDPTRIPKPLEQVLAFVRPDR